MARDYRAYHIVDDYIATCSKNETYQKTDKQVVENIPTHSKMGKQIVENISTHSKVDKQIVEDITTHQKTDETLEGQIDSTFEHYLGEYSRARQVKWISRMTMILILFMILPLIITIILITLSMILILGIASIGCIIKGIILLVSCLFMWSRLSYKVILLGGVASCTLIILGRILMMMLCGLIRSLLFLGRKYTHSYCRM